MTTMVMPVCECPSAGGLLDMVQQPISPYGALDPILFART